MLPREPAPAPAGLAAWLPRYEWTAGGERHTGRVGCDRLSRLATGTGVSLLTVLSFDLAGGQLGDGDPVSVASEADTVYGTAGSLYLADSAGAGPQPGWGGRWGSVRAQTDNYQFDTTGSGRPRYVAAGSVPGSLLNQFPSGRVTSGWPPPGPAPAPPSRPSTC